MMDDIPILAQTQSNPPLPSEKAAGLDAIPGEFLLRNCTSCFLQLKCVHEIVTPGFRGCNNHCRSSLLLTVWKILARILLNSLTMHLDQGLLPESQCGTMDTLLLPVSFRRNTKNRILISTLPSQQLV